MTPGTVLLLLMVFFADGSKPSQITFKMPSIEVCANALTARLSVTPSPVMDEHPVAGWSASCVMYVKTVGS